MEVVAVAPAAPFDRATSIRPPEPDEPSEAEFDVWRVFGAVDDPRGAPLSHGHAVLGSFEAGGTVVTAGCTEWAAALEAGDPHVLQITRNILDRLG
jgi:hypothetical protein